MTTSTNKILYYFIQFIEVKVDKNSLSPLVFSEFLELIFPQIFRKLKDSEIFQEDREILCPH